MQQFSKWNKGYRYLLMVLDVFSKYGWIVPLKDKKGETVAEAFKKIFKEGRKPQYLWTDKGKEYYNKHVKELLDKNKIALYSTENEEKSSVCERWNRTIKSEMWKQFTVQGNTMYLDMLPKILKQYNNTKHSSIKMTPIEASKKKNNKGLVYFNLYGDMETLKQKPKFKKGDKVRISKYKRNVFDKGYTPNWTEEVFTVDKIQYTNPITYKLKDLRGEDIQGSFYELELLEAKQDVFRIDKIIRRDYKKKQALVSWTNQGFKKCVNELKIKSIIHIYMEIFIYEGNELAIIKKDDDIWFRAKTVANILKYSNQRKAIIDHVDSEDKCSLNELKFRGNNSLPLTWNTKNTIYINESGLYSLILRSNMDKAKEFKRWVTNEVLPSIRKNWTV